MKYSVSLKSLKGYMQFLKAVSQLPRHVNAILLPPLCFCKSLYTTLFLTCKDTLATARKVLICESFSISTSGQQYPERKLEFPFGKYIVLNLRPLEYYDLIIFINQSYLSTHGHRSPPPIYSMSILGQQKPVFRCHQSTESVAFLAFVVESHRYHRTYVYV